MAQQLNNSTQETAFSRRLSRFDVPNTPELESVQKFLLNHDIEHLHGPERIDYAEDELIVLCLLRNGRPFIKSFIEHYFSLGAKHIVFLDNNSTDDTIEALKGYNNVTVLRSTKSFRRYQLLMRRYLIERFGKGRWTLLVDVDELFDYPLSDVVSLQSLLRYLNNHSYTAVAAHMLDMFPKEPLSKNDAGTDLCVKKTHRLYELSNFDVFEYGQVAGISNIVSNEDIPILTGGIQRRLFNHYPLLIKHPLIFYDGIVKPVDLSEHWVNSAYVADFSGILFHYKLSSSLYDLVQQEVNEQRYVNRWGKYERYHRVLNKSPELVIKSETTRELSSVNDLLGTQLATVSRQYMRMVADRAHEEGKPIGWNYDSEQMYRVIQQSSSQIKERNQQVRELQHKVSSFRQKLSDTQRQLDNIQSKVSDANVKTSSSKHQNQKPENYRQQLEHRNQVLEAQMRAIQSSRSWRLLTALRKMRLAMLGSTSIKNSLAARVFDGIVSLPIVASRFRLKAADSTSGTSSDQVKLRDVAQKENIKSSVSSKANSSSTRKSPQHPRGIKRVQVGCGPQNVMDEWWNVDIEAFPEIDEVLDAAKPWPYEGLEYVFGEHFLEHLSLDDSVRFLSNAGNSLQPGGRMRLSTPNLEWVLRTHYPYNSSDAAERIAATLNTNRAFRGWGHQFLYTKDMLGYLLSELGFDEVTFHSYGESLDPELKKLERHGKFRIDEGQPSVIIAEALKEENRIAASNELVSFLNERFLKYVGKRLTKNPESEAL